MDSVPTTSTKDRAIGIVSAGHGVFAAVMVALGILSLKTGDFAPIWSPGPRAVPAREPLVYLCAVVSVGIGVGLVSRRTAGAASRVLLGWFLLWLFCFNGPAALPAGKEVGSWYGCAETGVMVAGAWVLYAWFANDWERRFLGFATGRNGLRIARVLYGLTMIFFGVGHFAYPKQTVVLVPTWLPWPMFWAYFTGSTFVAAGVAVVIGRCAYRAAILSVVQMGLFILLVWLPLVASGHIDAFRWTEFVDTCALTAAGWVVADSYRRSLGTG